MLQAPSGNLDISKARHPTRVGASTPALLERQGGAHPQVVHALSNRFFEETGHLLQPNATAHKARSVLERTMASCRQARQK